MNYSDARSGEISAASAATQPPSETIAEWCERVPGLRRTSEQTWEADLRSSISYPESGHGNLANVEPNSYWFNHRNRVIAAIVANNPPPGPIFDVGGGNGYVSVGLASHGFPAVVIEPGKSGASTARARNLPVIQAAFQDLDIPEGSIPAVGLFDVLEHIEDDRAALAGLYRAITPGGVLYLAVPAHQLLWSEEDVFAGHFRRYTLNSLTRRVREAGFEPVFASYFFAALLLPIFLFRALPHKLGRRVGKPGDAEQQHRLPGGAIGRAIDATFAWELERVRRGRPVPVGASCLLACRKPPAQCFR